MRKHEDAPPFKERAAFSAVAAATPYKLGMWEWSPADMAMHEMMISEAAAPMRSMFDMLASGEVMTIKGKAVMEMPAGYGTVDLGEWVEIQPALEGWIDCLARIDEKLPNRALKQISRYLGAGLTLTPDLVTDARREFDAHLRRMRTMLPGQIKDAATTAQIAWEFEKMEKAA